MKIYFIIYLCIFTCISSVRAQVGINTHSPQGIFDLRVAEGMSQKGLAVTNDGTVIIGQSVSTTENVKLVIEGQMKIRTGNEGNNKFYIIDGAGVIDWKPLSLGSQYTIWRLASSAFTFTGTANQPLTGVSSFDLNQLAMTTGTNSLFIPKGKYLAIAFGDVTGNEFGELSLYKVVDNQNIFSIQYYDYLAGTATYIDMPSSQEVRLRVTPYSSTIGTWTFPITTNYFYLLTFLKLVE